MDDADVPADQWRSFLNATLCSKARIQRRPPEEFCLCCGEEMDAAWRALHPGGRICRFCDDEIQTTERA